MSKENFITMHLMVRGKVQGVYYRVSAKEAADNLGLTGWVQNLPDGNVEIIATGESEALAAFVQWCKEGPAGASVEEVTTVVQTREHFQDFSIRRS